MSGPVLCIAKGCRGTQESPEDPWHPHPASRGLFCDKCHRHLERLLAETPALIDLATREFLTPSQGGEDGSRHTKGHPPIPLNLDTHDAIQILTVQLGSWTTMVCEERDLRGPDHRNDPHRTSAWLLGQLDWITERSWADDFDQELQDSTRVLRGITQQTAEMVTLELVCPYCQEQSLRARKDASSDVTCRTEGCQDERGEVPRWTRQTWALLLGVAS